MRVCDFLLVCDSDLGPVSHHYTNIAGFMLMTPPLFHPILAVLPLAQIADVGVNVSRYLYYSVVKLFSKYSNLCDHGT